jgi:molecular chaperone GrpE
LTKHNKYEEHNQFNKVNSEAQAEQVEAEETAQVDEAMQAAEAQEVPEATDAPGTEATPSPEEKQQAEEAAKAQEELAKVQAQLKEKDQKIEELQNRLLRLQADFDNFRRRNNEEQNKLSKYVTASVTKEFLKVLDNFERAEQSLEGATDGKAIKVGMDKIHKQFEQALASLKIEEIKAQGEPFNPEIHEAVMQGANPDMADDTVDMVLEKGYKIGDNIIRHSKVRVVRNS